jgi:hypothetical protein
LAIKEDMLALDLSQQRRKHRKELTHKFTVRCLANCEMFILTIEDLEKMKMEFPEYYIELFNGAF